MRRARAVAMALATAALPAGCITPAPHLQELGPNSYMVTVRAEENPDGKKMARRLARQEADSFCQARGQHAATTHITGGVSDYLEGGDVEVNFRCQEQPSHEP